MEDVRGGPSRGLARAAVFLAVEAMAELCRRRLLVAAPLPPGRAAPALAAMLTLAWAYVAHRRLTFRGWGGRSRLAALLPFLTIGAAGLDLEALASRLGPEAVLAAWPALALAKYAALRALFQRGAGRREAPAVRAVVRRRG